MTLYETKGGIDVQIMLDPDAPAEWDRIPSGLLAHVDQLATDLDAAGPDWVIQITYGDIRDGTTDLTATPAITERKAA